MADDTDKTLLPFRSDRQDWQTPPWLWNALNAEFGFGVDLATSGPSNSLCEKYLTEADDALTVAWHKLGRAGFLNPPYGKRPKGAKHGGLGDWTAKAVEESRLGMVVVMVIPARVEADWWTRNVMPHASEVRFVAQRVTFIGPASNPAPVGTAVVIFRPPVSFPGPRGLPYTVRPLLQPAMSYLIREDS